MTSTLKEALPWVVGLIVLAVVITWLNDRTKNAKAREKDQNNPKAINSWWGAIALAVILIAYFGAMVLFGAATTWWTGFLIFGLLLIAVLRFVAWPLILAKMRGQPIAFTKTHSDGTMTMKCPTCRQQVSVEKNGDKFKILCPTCEQFTA